MKKMILSFYILNVCMNYEVLMLYTKLGKSFKSWKESLAVELPRTDDIQWGCFR